MGCFVAISGSFDGAFLFSSPSVLVQSLFKYSLKVPSNRLPRRFFIFFNMIGFLGQGQRNKNENGELLS